MNKVYDVNKFSLRARHGKIVPRTIDGCDRPERCCNTTEVNIQYTCRVEETFHCPDGVM